MKMAGTWLAVVAMAVAATLAGHWIGKRAASTSIETPENTSGQAAIRLLTAPFKGMDGKPRSLAEWRGRILVVNFWATWCPPCRAEIPGFSRLSDEFASNGVQFVGIAVDDETLVRTFSAERPLRYPILLGDPDALSLTAPLGNPTQGLPFTAVIDRTGRLALVKLGAFGEDDLRSKLEVLVARP